MEPVGGWTWQIYPLWYVDLKDHMEMIIFWHVEVKVFEEGIF